MKIIPIIVEDGILKVPDNFKIEPESQLSILLTKKGEEEISVFEGNDSFSFLYSEPDLYNDTDIVAERKNEKYNK
jgi:hypothetical protein